MAINLGFPAATTADFQAFSTKKGVDDKETKIFTGTADEDRKGRKYSYLIFKLSANGKDIETEVKGYTHNFKNSESKAELANWEKNVFPEFVKTLGAEKSPRYAVIEVQRAKEGMNQSKVLCIRWSPDATPGLTAIRERMTYSSGENSFKSRVSLPKVYQATDVSQLNLPAMIAAAFSEASGGESKSKSPS